MPVQCMLRSLSLKSVREQPLQPHDEPRVLGVRDLRGRAGEGRGLQRSVQHRVPELSGWQVQGSKRGEHADCLCNLLDLLHDPPREEGWVF